MVSLWGNPENNTPFYTFTINRGLYLLLTLHNRRTFKGLIDELRGISKLTTSDVSIIIRTKTNYKKL